MSTKLYLIAVQNLIFGQLGGIAFTMHEIGLPEEEVGVHIMIVLSNID